MSVKKREKRVIGWREIVALPEFAVAAIKVKVDTGARTSALHVSKVQVMRRRGKEYVDFVIHPKQRTNHPEIHCTAELKDHRHVVSSSGLSTLRPVVETLLRIGDEEWPIEVTLVNRDVMGFRMLLGRQALRGRFCVDPSRSFLARDGARKKVTRKRRLLSPK